MESLFLNMFLTLKLSYMVRFLAAVFLFSWKLPKQPRYWRRMITWSALCLLAAALIPVLSQSSFYIASMFLVEFLLAMCGNKICCKAEWNVVFYIGAAVLSAEHIASMIDSLIAMLWPNVLSFSRVHRITLPILLNWVLVAAVVYVIIYRWMFQSKSIALEHSLTHHITLMLLIVSLAVNLYMNIIYSSLVHNTGEWDSFFEYGLNILVSLFLLLVQAGMMRQSQTEKRLQTVSMLWEQAREQYQVSKENIEAINIKCHDLKHQLLAIKDKTDDAEYKSMMEMIDSYGAEIKTNNEVLDVVFQEKNFQCRKLGIQFTCIIDGAALNFMETTDLYVLFGNLIDNCIEAVSRLPKEENKIIQVTVRRDKGFVIVSTENSYQGELKWADGRLRTSKADKSNHGFGLLSIERIIKRYNGRYSISPDNHVFCINIVFPVNADGKANA